MDDSKPRGGRRELPHTVGTAGLFGLAGCSDGCSSGSGGTGTTDDGSSETSDQGTVNSARASLTQPGDHGRTYQNDQAVQAVDEKFDGENDSFLFQEMNSSVPQNDAEIP